LKPLRANNSPDPNLKKALHKNRAGGVAQGISLEFKLQDCKTTTTKKNPYNYFTYVDRRREYIGSISNN
jgi:hypothetical protein